MNKVDKFTLPWTFEDTGIYCTYPGCRAEVIGDPICGWRPGHFTVNVLLQAIEEHVADYHQEAKNEEV